MRNLKWILLGIYLILVGLSLLGVSLGGGVVDPHRRHLCRHCRHSFPDQQIVSHSSNMNSLPIGRLFT